MLSPSCFRVSLIVNAIVVFYQLYLLIPKQNIYTYIDDDHHPRELPLPVPLRTVNMRFFDDPLHYPIAGTQAWAEWNAIPPPDGGHVFLGNAHFSFGVSMWHQIHCLNHIRALFVNGDDGSEHTEHCFHYLRQGILCKADTTLEEVDVNFGSGSGEGVVGQKRPLPGQGVTHVCKDWKAVYDWTTAEHAKWTPEMQARYLEPSPAKHKDSAHN